MNRFAYRMAGYAVKAFTDLSKARIRTYGKENIPKGALIFAINHFTRIETLLIPYQLHRLTGLTFWNLADYELFDAGLAGIFNRLGVVSTRNPDRDRLMVKTLLTGEAAWIVFPEGRMVKSKKVYDPEEKVLGRFRIASPAGYHPPRTGTATLALRTEFYRQRIRIIRDSFPEEIDRLARLFQIDQILRISNIETFIVPVNVTYYPIRAKENALSRLAELFIGELSERVLEEIITEGTMLLAGVDMDIRFGAPIRIAPYLKSSAVQKDIASLKPINFDDPIPSRPMMRKTAVRIMERYMSNIYGMTTVNHDHLLVTLLKYYPSVEIDEKDLRRRAYLATTLNFQKMGIYRHESLIQNQIHLLTDDRYGKIDNFVSFAIDKKIIRRDGDKFVKMVDFSESGEFHRVRIDHPAVVILNEIEPLTELQEHLEALALEHGLRVKHRLQEYLISNAAFAYERDYAAYAVEGESKGADVGAPFLIRGQSGKIGIVLVHGYMAAPLEVRALAEYLGSMGYWVYVPRLKGHGTAPDDLAGRRYMEWVESVEEGYAIMADLCRIIVVGGFSAGGGLAMDLCTRVSNIAGVFAISPPFKLHDFSARFVPAVNLWNRLMKRMNVESARKEFVENRPENSHINYVRNPLSGLMELDHLMEQLGDKISSIAIPALIVQSYSDPVVHYNGSLKIFKLLGSRQKEYLMVNQPRHGIVNGEGADRIFRIVHEFIQGLEPPASVR
ncbi:MAG: alpha/beta fold hydrolase [Desulfobacteraceae bacterium]|nr:MAG: alpha/beta fold hydrolase [Desulfobacteraceae bacterium]